MKKAIAAALCVALAGCASSSVLVGTRRPEIEPDQVKLYLAPPAQFEQVALLEASSNGAFALTSRQKTNKVVERLKAEAATLGANGVLLQGIGNEYAGSVGTGTATMYGNTAVGMGFSAPVMNKAGSAIAIWVPVGLPQAEAQMPPPPPAAMADAAPTAPQPPAQQSECRACKDMLKGG